MSDIIVSVPHTGTRFLMERLGIKSHVHTNWEWERQIREISKHNNVVTPMREPSAVWHSWCRRNQSELFPYGAFFMAWAGLNTIDQMFRVDVVCVDRQDDPHKRINDWSHIAKWEAEESEILPIDLRSVYDLPIVRRYYRPDSEAVLPYNHYYFRDRDRDGA